MKKLFKELINQLKTNHSKQTIYKKQFIFIHKISTNTNMRNKSIKSLFKQRFNSHISSNRLGATLVVAKGEAHLQRFASLLRKRRSRNGRRRGLLAGLSRQFFRQLLSMWGLGSGRQRVEIPIFAHYIIGSSFGPATNSRQFYLKMDENRLILFLNIFQVDFHN